MSQNSQVNILYGNSLTYAGSWDNFDKLEASSEHDLSQYDIGRGRSESCIEEYQSLTKIPPQVSQSRNYTQYKHVVKPVNRILKVNCAYINNLMYRHQKA